MNFKNAEILINTSLKFGGPSFMIIGDNGIGKTKMLEEMFLKFKTSSKFISQLDYGGLRQIASLMINEKKKNICIADMQNILMRKSAVVTSTLGFMYSAVFPPVT